MFSNNASTRHRSPVFFLRTIMRLIFVVVVFFFARRRRRRAEHATIFVLLLLRVVKCIVVHHHHHHRRRGRIIATTNVVQFSRDRSRVFLFSEAQLRRDRVDSFRGFGGGFLLFVCFSGTSITSLAVSTSLVRVCNADVERPSTAISAVSGKKGVFSLDDTEETTCFCIAKRRRRRRARRRRPCCIGVAKSGKNEYGILKFCCVWVPLSLSKKKGL